MSRKPPKKSDLEKKWMAARRDRSIQMQPEYHLIVTEGSKTEPAYFNAIKEIVNKNFCGKIQLHIYGEGNNTVSLFRKAHKRALESPNIYQHVWIVYDTDDFPDEHIDLTETLCIECSNDETTYHAIWSNQCIELWFLLHFSYLQADLHCAEYWPKLSEKFRELGLGDYTKNREDIFDVLSPNINSAIRNAKYLAKINEGKKPSQSAPGTKIYELIEKLYTYLF